MAPENKNPERGSYNPADVVGLEAPMSSFQTAAVPPTRTTMSFKSSKLALFIAAAAIITILLVTISGLLFGIHPSKTNNQTDIKTSSYAVRTLPLGNVKPSNQLQIGQADRLVINGQLRAENTIVLSPSGVPSSPTAGQIYYDKNTNAPYYYNGTQFVSLAPSQAGQTVTSLAGVSGAIGVGGGLQVTNGQLALSAALTQSLDRPAVTSLQGQNGAVTLSAGTGIDINGTTISNTGITGITGGNGLGVSQSDGVATLTLPQELGVQSTPSFRGLFLINALTVPNGGTGSDGSGYANGGVFYYNGSNFLTSDTPTANGLCLLSGPSGPYFGPCVGNSNGVASLNGAMGALAIDNASADLVSGHITIQDASTTQKGLIQLVSDDFSVIGGVASLSGSVTKAGNTFNSSGQLVKLDTNGQSMVTGQCLLSTGTGASFTNCPVGGNVSSGATQTPGALTKFDATTNHIVNSIASELGTTLTVGGTVAASAFQGSGANLTNLNISNVTTGTLAVAHGGTGQTSFTTNGLLLGNGASALNTVAPGATGDCLVMVAGVPTFTTCTGAGGVSSVNTGTGALTLQGTNGVTVSAASGGIITITGPTITTGVSSLNGLVGALAVANASAANGTITLNDASTSQKGIASYSSSNFSVVNGAVDTVQGIGTAATPTFASLILQSAGAGLSGVGANGTTKLQFATQAGSDTKTVTIPNATGTVAVNALGPLSIDANGTISCASCLTSGSSGGITGVSSINTLNGTLTIVGANGLTVSNSGSTITLTSPTAAAAVNSLNGETGALAVANASAANGTITLNDASTSQKGIASFNGDDFSLVNGAVSLGVSVTKMGNAFNAASQLVQLNSDGYLPVLDGSQLTNLTAANINGTLSVAQGGTGQASFIANGLLIGNDTGALNAIAPGNNGECLVMVAGTPTFTTCTGAGGVSSINTLTGAISVSNGTGLGLTTVGNTLTLSNTGVTRVTGTANQIITSDNTGSTTLSLPQNIDTAAAIQFATAVLTGSNALTVGQSGLNNGALLFKNGTNGFSTTLQSGTPGADLTFTLPSADGAAGQCLVTNASGALSFASCLSGSGGSGGSGVASLQGGSGGGTISGALTVSNATTAGSTVTLDTATTTNKGIASFNAGDFSVVNGAASLNTVSVGKGGTGLTATPTNGQLLIGNGTGYTLAGLNSSDGSVVVTNGAGTIDLKVANAGSIGTCATCANQALSNLSGVALNTNLLPGVANSIDLGSSAKTFANGYFTNLFGATATISGTAAVQGAGGLTLGVAGTTPGQLVLATTGSSVTLSSGPQSNAVALNIPSGVGSSDDICLKTLANCSGANGGSGNTNYIFNQTALQAGSNFNVSGVGKAGVLNGATAIQLNGTDINTAGTLTNVAYLNQTNTFSQPQAINSAGGKATLALTSTGTNTGITFGGDTTLYRSAANTLQTDGSLVVGSNLNVSGTATAGSFVGDGAGLTNLTAANITGTLTVLQGGTGQTSFSTNGLLVGNGTGALNTIAPGSNGQCLVMVAGVPTFTTCTGAGGVSSVNGLNGAVLVSGGVGINLAAAGNTLTLSNTGVTNIAGTANQINVSANTGALTVSLPQNIDMAASVQFGTAALTGANALTLGQSSANTGALIFKNSTNNFNTTLQSGTPGANLAFTLPSADGTAGQCLTTNASGVLSFASCLSGNGGPGSGVASLQGGSGGSAISGLLTIANATTAGNTVTIDAANTTTKGIASFTASDFSVNSGVVSLNTVAVANGGTGLTDIPTNGQLLIGNGTGYSLATLTQGTGIVIANSAGGITISAPNSGSCTSCAAGNNVVNSLIGNAVGSVPVNGALTINDTLTSGSTVTINTASTGIKGIASFSADNFTVTSGAVAIKADGVALGTQTTGNYVATINGGNGLTVIGSGTEAAGISLGLNIQASKGLEADTNGLSLIDCASGQLLKYNASDQWACGTDSSGTSTIGTLDSQTKSANGAVISGTSLVLQSADTAYAGLVNTVDQTFAGAKTFNNGLTVNSSSTTTTPNGLTVVTQSTAPNPAGSYPNSITTYYTANTVQLSGGQVGLNIVTNFAGTQNIGNGSGINSTLNFAGTSGGELVALNGEAKNNGTGTLGNLEGVGGRVWNNSTGIVQNGYTLLARTPINGGGGTINTQYGLLVQAQSGTGITTAYGIYQAGANDLNVLSGATSINNSNAANTLTVNHSNAAGYALLVNNSSNATSNGSGSLIGLNLNPASDQSGTASNLYVQTTANGGANNMTGIRGIYSPLNYTGTGTLGTAGAITGSVTNSSTGTIIGATGVTANIVNGSTGTIRTATALYAASPSNATGGTIQAAYGLAIQSQAGTGIGVSYGISQAGASDLNVFNGSTSFNNSVKIQTNAASSSTYALSIGNGAGTNYSGFNVAVSGANATVGLGAGAGTNALLVVGSTGYGSAITGVASGTVQGILVTANNTAGANVQGVVGIAVAGGANTASIAGVVSTVRSTVSGAVTNAYGMQAAAPIVSAGSTITNNYGVYIEGQSGTGITNGYGIYQAGTNDLNVLNGATTIKNVLTVTGSLGAITTTSSGNNLNFSRAGANYVTATDAAGSLNLGAGTNTNLLALGAAGTVTANGTLSVTGNTGIGSTSNVNQKLRVVGSSTDPTTTQLGIYGSNSVALTASNSSSLQGIGADLSVTGSGASTGIVAAVSGNTNYNSTGTGSNINAGNFVTTQGSSGGGISTARGIYSRVDNNSTTAIQNAYGLEIGTNIGSGTIVNNTGLRIGVLNGTSNAFGIQIDTPVGGTNSAAIYLSGTGGTAASGILFGPDTNLYRSAANTLQTDDNFVVASGKNLKVTGNTTLQTTTNSTTAFQVQNASGSSLLTIDTTASIATFNQTQVKITGASTGATPGAPTITSGSSTGGTLVSGQQYYYKVTAVTNTGESNPSPESSFTVPSTGGIAAPTSAPTADDNYSYTDTPLCASACSYKYTYVNSSEAETTPSPASPTLSGIYNTIYVSGIRAGPAGTTARNLYLQSASYFGDNNFHWIDTIRGNTTTDYEDNGPNYWSGSLTPPPTTNGTGTTTNTLNLSWAGVAGATSYKIYRGTAAGAENVLVASPTATTYTDTGSGSTAAVPSSTTPPSLQVAGTTLLQTTTNVTNAFQIQNASAATALIVSTNNLVVGYNSADAILKVGKDSVTNRSINAAGTINATGADYAEYIPWTGAKPSQGSIVSYNGSNYIVSSETTAAFIGNDKFTSTDSILVTFAGQVPVRVTGVVHKGDLLINNGDGTAKAVSPSDATIGEILAKLAIAQADSADPSVKLVQASVGTTSDSMATALQNQSATFADVNVLGSGSFGSLNVSGATTLTSLTVTGDAAIQGTLTVTAIKVGDIEISGHIVTKGGQPTSQAQTAAGEDATVTVSGTDTSGTITITTGSTPTAGALAKMLFSKTYGASPHIVLSPSNEDASDLRYFKGVTDSNGFVLNTKSAPVPNTTYTFDYFIAQ